MSFMFNPFPYEDSTAINRPRLTTETVASLVSGTTDIASMVYDGVTSFFDANPEANTYVLGMDGYVSAEWSPTITVLEQYAAAQSLAVEVIDVRECYKTSSELDALFQSNLPTDRNTDPVLLFGKLFHGDITDLCDSVSLKRIRTRIQHSRCADSDRKTLVIVYGCGSACAALRDLYECLLYYDVTPKQTILRIKEGLVKNLGDDHARPFRELMRRAYYIDFEVTGRLREDLLNSDAIDFYVASDDAHCPQCIPIKEFRNICTSLVERPFRCKPVYIEGVWGGEFIRKVRHLPEAMKNCAWVFDLIPLEVSVLVEVGSQLMEIPFLTFVKQQGTKLMGEACVNEFDGFFPIRFNYDDTFHSNGHMSIQVHPNDHYIQEHHSEHGRQDESYYVVETGHGAKTYLGFEDGIDIDEFFDGVRSAETQSMAMEYERYVHSVPSAPGTQIMLPAGTIHASGRNQVVLEIGSLTVGSYTYKLYDYLRLDLDGQPRPIHSSHGMNVLDAERTATWVEKNLVQSPECVRKGESWAEYIVGEHELLYFSLRRLEFEEEIECDTEGVFHVLTLVDGEKIRVESKNSPEQYYEQNWLEIVVVPACIGKYVVKNLGAQPVCVHLARLKDGFDTHPLAGE